MCQAETKLNRGEEVRGDGESEVMFEHRDSEHGLGRE